MQPLNSPPSARQRACRFEEVHKSATFPRPLPGFVESFVYEEAGWRKPQQRSDHARFGRMKKHSRMRRDCAVEGADAGKKEQTKEGPLSHYNPPRTFSLLLTR
jgi:hypothetical protein